MATRGRVLGLASRSSSTIHLPTNDKFNIVFCGNDEFSCGILSGLHAANDVWDKILVVTNQNRSHGRDARATQISPVKTLAENLNLSTYLLTNRRSLSSWSYPSHWEEHGVQSRVLITASFGQIVPRTILRHFLVNRRLNIHPSLLPALRGPAPIQHSIAEDHRVTGISIIGIEPFANGIDSGDLWEQKHVGLSGRETFLELRDRLSCLGSLYLVSLLRRMLVGTVATHPQNTFGVSYAPRVDINTARLDFSQWDAHKIICRHRAFGHQKPLRVSLGSTQLQIKDFYVRRPGTLTGLLKEAGDAIYCNERKALIIRCANNSEIAVTRVKQEGRKLLDVSEWINGLPHLRKTVIKF